MRVFELVRQAIGELAGVGIEEGDTDVQLLLGHCLGKSRTELFLAADEDISDHDLKNFQNLLQRRKMREPLAYILGEREFWSLPFTVSPAVLIPRPETEFLLEQALAAVHRKNLPEGRILDLCCGSGVIAVVLALELGRKVTAVDISSSALRVARENCLRHGVGEKVNLIQADLLGAFSPHPSFSLVVSNPPYVSRLEVQQGLEPEVALYEPHLALDGGERGLDVIQRIRDGLPGCMLPGGEVFIEIGADQGPEVQRLFAGIPGAAARYNNVEILKDYAGRDRVLHATVI